MPRKSKKKLQELTQADGKNENFQPTTLQQIWGDDGLSKYKTLDVEVYIKQVKSFNLSDLRSHAMRLGVVPAMNRERIEKQLITKFRQHANLYQKPASINVHPKDMSEDKVKAALDILSAVR